jgi:MFS family permease
MESRAKGMALIGAAFALGFTLGPSLGIVALLAGGEIALSPWPGYLASALSGVALVMAIFLLPESYDPGASTESRRLFDWRALRGALSIPSLGLLLAASFIAVFSFANFESTLSLQIEQIVKEQGRMPATGVLGWLIGKAHAWGYSKPEEVRLIAIFAVFIALGFTLTIAQGFLVRRMAGRVSEGAMAGLGAVTAIIGFALLALAAARNDFHLLLGAMTLEVTGFAFVNPSLQSLISRRSNPAEQGGILGLSQSFASLARILGPLLGITLFASSALWPYVAALGLMVAALGMIALAIPHGHDFNAEER